VDESGTARDLQALRDAFVGRELGPPLGWDGVRAFEAACGAVLPDPYRSFAALVGNGCCSGPPAYGLVPLRSDPKDCPWTPADSTRLARPFPLTRPWIWEGGDAPPLAEVTFSTLGNGILFLGHDGCGSYWMLVVTGAHRGQVWNITDVGAQPFGRSFGYTTAAVGFAGWAVHWASGKDWYDAKGQL
jgi:hypothetical protein